MAFCISVWRFALDPLESYIIGLGDYTGGELVFSDKKSPYYGSHNIKNKWFKFVGDT